MSVTGTITLAQSAETGGGNASALSDYGEASPLAEQIIGTWLDFLPGDFLYVGPSEIVVRLGAALVAGLLLGLDREIRGRPAGVRTYMLVSVGAATYSMVTMEMVVEMAQAGNFADPKRVAQGLVGGIGFLGAGAIIQSRGQVGGLATAASIWVAGAVGMACGLGYYSHALLLAVVTAVLLALSRFIEGRGGEHEPGGHQARPGRGEKAEVDE